MTNIPALKKTLKKKIKRSKTLSKVVKVRNYFEENNLIKTFLEELLRLCTKEILWFWKKAEQK